VIDSIYYRSKMPSLVPTVAAACAINFI